MLDVLVDGFRDGLWCNSCCFGRIGCERVEKRVVEFFSHDANFLNYLEYLELP
ncbi:hypothetical protein HanIR_Chr11g0527591 [Helianthus annuus]|nr:hypothetical protein HanIR_Chr11g0527591 [Helianthus annuus]